VVLSSRRLLQAVEGPVEPTHQLTVSGVNEVSGLGAINRLNKGVIEESVLDIELVHRPTSGDD
jgi:hypothetical protein